MNMMHVALHLILLGCLGHDLFQVSAVHGVDFILYNKTRNWLDAYTVCSSSDGSLLEIRDQLDFNVLQNMTRTALWESSVSGMVWLGLYRRSTDPFKWSSCDELGSTTFWGQADDLTPTGSACVAIEPTSLLWVTLPCSTQIPFVCQRDVGPCSYSQKRNGNCTVEGTTRLNHEVNVESACQEKCDHVLTPEGEHCWAYFIPEHAQTCETVHSSDPFLCDKNTQGTHTVSKLTIRRCFTLTANTTTSSDVVNSNPTRDVCHDEDTNTDSADLNILGIRIDFGLNNEEETHHSTVMSPIQEGDVTTTPVVTSIKTGSSMLSVSPDPNFISKDDFSTEQIIKRGEEAGDVIQLQSSLFGNYLEPSDIHEVLPTLRFSLNSEVLSKTFLHSILEDSYPTNVAVLMTGSSLSIPEEIYVSPDVLLPDVSALPSIPIGSLISKLIQPIDVSPILPELEIIPTTLCCCVSKNVSELPASYIKVIQALKVNKSTLSSARRKLVSVPDDRPSSQTIGYVGLVFVTLALSCMVLADLMSFFSKINKCHFGA